MDAQQILESCEGFDWDDDNWEKNWRRHQVAPYECEQVFFNEPLVVYPDKAESVKEQRYYALGQSDESRWLFVAFTVRTKLIRVISARDMTPRERKEYKQR